MAQLSKVCGSLSAVEFASAIARFPRGLSDKARMVAQAILVEGYTQAQAAEEFGTSRQLAYQWANKVYEQFAPAGWVTEAVTLPPAIMAEVRRMQAMARDEWESLQPPPRVGRRRAETSS